MKNLIHTIKNVLSNDRGLTTIQSVGLTATVAVTLLIVFGVFASQSNTLIDAWTSAEKAQACRFEGKCDPPAPITGQEGTGQKAGNTTGQGTTGSVDSGSSQSKQTEAAPRNIFGGIGDGLRRIWTALTGLFRKDDASKESPLLASVEQKCQCAVQKGSKEWSQSDLELLNQALSDLPSGFRSRMSLDNIKRDSVCTKEPDCKSWLGVYYPSEDSITIYDGAKSSGDFGLLGTDGNRNFKGTIVHELTHSIQTDKLSEEYAKMAGWEFDSLEGTWKFKGDKKSLPTTYGGTNPHEDMAESVMLYAYDPQRLRKASPERYDFLKTKIFDGTEYK